MLRVGLTGGIACGKSHVLQRLRQRGFGTLDLDAVAHETMEPGAAAYDDVVAAFGPGILGRDGRIDRKALGARVFSEPSARDRLNAIVHPRVRAEEARRAARYREGGGAAFVTDAALLVEAGVHLRFDRLVVVHCDPEEQLRRLVARDGLAEDAARARLLSQMPIGEKRRFGHWQVDTSGTIALTHGRTDALAGELRALAAAPPRSFELSPERALGLLVHGPVRGPRSLDPKRLLREIVETGGLEMERLASMLVPPGAGPWYRRGSGLATGGGVSGEPGPETLAGPLLLWAGARRGSDAGFLLAAAASLARLTHGDGVSVAAACLFVLALSEVARLGGLPADLDARLAIWRAQAQPWAEAPPPARIEAALKAAARHPQDAAAAREAARAAGLDPGPTGAVVGLLAGTRPDEAPADLREAVRTLLDHLRPSA